MSITPPAEYRRRAANCVEMAQHAPAAERRTLLDIATMWVNLADAIEKDNAIVGGDSVASLAPRK